MQFSFVILQYVSGTGNPNLPIYLIYLTKVYFRYGRSKPEHTTNDLIRSYKCGNLQAFNHYTTAPVGTNNIECNRIITNKIYCGRRLYSVSSVSWLLFSLRRILPIRRWCEFHELFCYLPPDWLILTRLPRGSSSGLKFIYRPETFSVFP